VARKSVRRVAERVVNGLLGRFGLRVSRIESADAILDPSARSIALGNTARTHNARANMDAFYADPNLLSHYFTEERLGFYRQVCERLVALNIRPSSILDVGCGSGHLLVEVRRAFPAAQVIGTDFSPESIRLARELHPLIQFQVQDVFELGKIGHQFDLVLCTEVLEHLEDADLAMEALHGACRVGGTIAVTVPDGCRDTFAGHFNFWTPESFRREFRRLDPIVEELGSYLFIAMRRR
jgi:SAM-dependent methyltransferase